MPRPMREKSVRATLPGWLKVLEEFEDIFAVLKDDDAAKVCATIEWAQAEGLADKISPETAELAKASSRPGKINSYES